LSAPRCTGASFSHCVSPSSTAQVLTLAPFSAPEILRGEPYDQSADTFSFALTLVACFKRGRAYDITESFRLKDVKFAQQRPRIPPWLPGTGTGCPESVAALVERCWDEDARKRPPLRRVVAELEVEMERIADEARAAAAASEGGAAGEEGEVEAQAAAAGGGGAGLLARGGYRPSEVRGAARAPPPRMVTAKPNAHPRELHRAGHVPAGAVYGAARVDRLGGLLAE